MPTLWDSYVRYFRDFHPILRNMSRRGIPIDDGKRQELKELIARENLRVTAAIQPLVPESVKGFEPKMGYKRVPKDLSGLVEADFLLSKEEKCQCTKKLRGSCPVCLGTGVVPVGSVVRRWARRLEFNRNSPKQKTALIRALKHTVPKHAKRVDVQGEAAETSEARELERLFAKTKHPVYPLLIEGCELTKISGTLDGWLPAKDQAVHTTYTYQTATWQTSSRAPNVQNGLKHGKTEFKRNLAKGFNAMQHARPGRVLVNFDFKSFHALTTAHDFTIPDYARLARIDIHSFVTCYFLRRPERERLWAMADEEMALHFKELKKNEEFKFTRDFKAKRAILGIQFGMGYRKLYQINRDDFASESEAKTVWEMVYALFPRLRKAQDEVRQRAAEEKCLRNQFGAVRHFYDVTRWDRKAQRWMPGEQAEQAVAFLPASHAFGHVREMLLECEAKGYPERYGFVNQIHDSVVAHCPRELVDECVANVLAEMRRPSAILNYPAMGGAFQVDAEASVGESMAEMRAI